jgi:hypothetical protein
MERVVSLSEELQRGALTQPVTEGLQVLRIGEGITSTLQEQHGHVHLEKVLSSLFSWAAGRVKGKGKKRQAENAG